MDNKKKAIIIGAGPAGLTAALEMLRTTAFSPLVVESTDAIGGISQTVEYNGNHIDIGGHRFFSKDEHVVNWWKEIMPLQGAPSKDDILISNNSKNLDGSPDMNPEKEDNMFLLRNRVSRIYFNRRFFDYPISLSFLTLKNLGLKTTISAGWGYMVSLFRKLPETSLENFYINRFGRPLYEMFFEDYTEKVWGVHPSKIGADWGKQRVRGLSVWAIIWDVIAKKIFTNKHNVETSLIEEFIYPKFGPGQFWTKVSKLIEEKGGSVTRNSEVTRIILNGNKVKTVEYTHPDGSTEQLDCDCLISSMCLKDLIAAIAKDNDVPADVQRIASNLQYRDFITVGLSLKKLKIDNHTPLKTYKNRIPDTWIYIQDKSVKLGRLQIFNNWSPYMVNDYENSVWMGLEYFATEGDTLWQMDEKSFIEMAKDELEKIGIIDKQDVQDACLIKIKKAYPSYIGAYKEIETLKNYLDSIENLYCIGRNGQHRYNNMDHSILTAMACVENIKNDKTSKENIWSINTEQEYHESKS